MDLRNIFLLAIAVTFARDTCGGGRGSVTKWGLWGPCSALCGRGKQHRSRSCTASGKLCNQLIDSRNCRGKLCSGSGTPCGPSEECNPRDPNSCHTIEITWGECKGNRKCYQEGIPQCKCGVCGRLQSTRRECQCPPSNKWTSFGPCTESCGAGASKTRTRLCTSPVPSCVNGIETEVQNCDLSPCPAWSPWNSKPCSHSCGGGKIISIRTCGYTLRNRWKTVKPVDCPGFNTKSENCNMEKCPPKWGPWGDCSVVCGNGIQTRTRDCSGIPGCDSIEEKECFGGDSCPGWTVWKRGKCNAPCGGGDVTSIRNCASKGGKGKEVDVSLCPGGLSTITEKCNIHKCPEWVNSGEPSACSAECGNAVRIQQRNCVEYDTTGQQKVTSPSKCEGGRRKVRIKIDCELPECPGQWQPWSACSVACGGLGTKERIRTCPTCDNKIEKEVVDCDSGYTCPTLSEWKDGQCSVSCGVGTYTTTRFCYVQKTGSSNKEKVDFSKCGSDTNEITNPCTEPTCPEWGDWSGFSECDKQCMKTRTRTCYQYFDDGRRKKIDPSKCQGSAEETVKCDKAVCTEFECSLSCGGGARYEFEACDKEDKMKCPGKYVACNTQPCPTIPVNCPAGEEQRYNTQSCCKLDDNVVTFYDDSNNLQKLKCGTSVSQNPKKPFGARIIDGTDVAGTNFWPYMAVFVNSGLCGATLITNQFLVTAAHCVKSDNKIMPYDSAIIKIGMLRYKDLHNSRVGESRRVKKVYVPDDYIFPQKDIAVIKKIRHRIFHSTNNTLNQADSPFTSFVRPACLPRGEIPADDQKCVAIGWGMTDAKVSKAASTLQEVNLRILTKDICQRAWSEDNNPQVRSYVNPLNAKFDGAWVCAGSMHKSTDTCRGDSGGPLLCQRCSSCEWYVAGVTSFGPSACGTPGIPGVYTSVTASEYEFIRKTANIVDDTPKSCNSASAASVRNFDVRLLPDVSPQRNSANHFNLRTFMGLLK